MKNRRADGYAGPESPAGIVIPAITPGRGGGVGALTPCYQEPERENTMSKETITPAIPDPLCINISGENGVSYRIWGPFGSGYLVRISQAGNRSTGSIDVQMGCLAQLADALRVLASQESEERTALLNLLSVGAGDITTQDENWVTSRSPFDGG